MADRWLRFPTHTGWWWVWDDVIKLEPAQFFIEEIGHEPEPDGRPYLKARGFDKRYHPNNEVTYCEVKEARCPSG